MNKNIKIFDNFLNDDIFFQLKNILLSDIFPWYFNKKTVSFNDENKILNTQFTHTFYRDNHIHSDFFNILLPIIEKINIVNILKIKANLQVATEKSIINGFHIDQNIAESTTAIYYINTNNGKTIFEDNTYVDSIENRFLEFNSNILHSGSTCTNKKVRCLINFNYIK